ncbi:MAG: DUF1080 domain-containing protein [Chryseolinea sp.]
MHIILSLLLTSAAIFLSGLSNEAVIKTGLFNGKDLKGWDTYVGPAYDSIQQKFSGDRLGLNGTQNVFSVVMEDGSPAIRVSGERFGGISTTQNFHNYHLQLEFKWGKLKWNPKRSSKRDSGLLYHAVGNHGADGGFWMRSQEFQIQEGDCGDYWGCAGGVADAPAVEKISKKFIFTPAAPLLTFSEKSPQGRNCIKSQDGEKPSGQWNVIDLYCYGDTSVHVVNGVVNMILYHSRQLNGETESTLKSGKIQLQSEGAELFYRRISVEPITGLPKRVMK